MNDKTTEAPKGAQAESSAPAPEAGETRPEAGKPKQSGPGAKPPSGGKGGGWLAVLALLVAIGASADLYFVWKRLGTIDAALARTESALSRERDQLTQSFEARIAELEAAQRQYGEQYQAMERMLEEIRRTSSQGEAQWTLAEAEYLLQIANERLQLARDPATALAALNAADQRLAQLQDPGLNGVREQIAREREALKALPRIDVSGMALTLGSLVEQVESLPLRRAHRGSRVMEPDTETGETVTGWRGFLQAVWNEIKRLVVIRRSEQPLEPMLAPELQYGLYQNLRLQLQSARLALLDRDGANFARSLQAARDWLAQHFDVDDPAVQSLDATLQELSAVELTQTLPDLSGSLQALRAYRTRLGAQAP